MSKNQKIHYFDSNVQMVEKAAKMIYHSALTAIRKNNCFSLVLSGGNTPKPLFAKFAESPYKEQMPWNRTHIFWGDERCVPLDNEFSNFNTANELLLSKIEIPPDNIHCFNAENLSSVEAAEKYETNIKKFFNEFHLKSFDVVLLGMGEDGHTASLFPGSSSLEEKNKWVIPVDAPTTVKPEVPRITMTYPLINKSEDVLFLISGQNKINLAEGFLSGKSNLSEEFPAFKISSKGTIHWFLCLNPKQGQ